MAQRLMFVYALIIFLSLFCVEANKIRRKKITCVTESDCPQFLFNIHYMNRLAVWRRSTRYDNRPKFEKKEKLLQ
ncbi:unnamed protein product [Lathyrus oleraceus]